MLLSDIGYTGKKAEILIKRGISTGDALLYSMPKRYLYFDKTYSLELTKELIDKIENSMPIAVIGTVKLVDNEYKRDKNISLIKIRVEDEQSGNILFVNFLGNYHMLEYYKSCFEKRVIVGGKLQYNSEYKSFSMLNPMIFSKDIAGYNKILPVYRKYKGISEDYYEKSIKEALNKIEPDYLPERLRSRYGLLTYSETVHTIHNPLTADAITKAEQRTVFDSLLYFAISMARQQISSKGESEYRIHKKSITEQMISELPYSLTEGQDVAIKDMINTSHRGEKISALIQGDVGSGKTIVAMSIMFAMAENGYQSVLMAPTTVLAKQHYKDFKTAADKYGFNAVLLSNELKTKEREDVLAQIKSGKADFIIGTHSCISASVEYNKLGLTVTDEEHRFGVAQREELINKAKEGVHSITMSGTPIPRTLANTLYGDNVKVYSLKLPAERKPIQTAICRSDKPIFEWIEKEVALGHQCYVVCPLIDEADEDSKMTGISSIEATLNKYNDYFMPKGIITDSITGKTPKEEQDRIMQAFMNNRFSILISTTVIEVGVNNPNATVMVITGAERFGLATLHQLRGRVGRGRLKSYCILQKTPGYERGSNLEILCRETDGLEIAKEDLKNRGMGNLIGFEQSGKNEFIELMIKYPIMYDKIKSIAKDMINQGLDIAYTEEYEKRYIS